MEFALPSLLATQLLAAEVYAEFLRLSSGWERQLWKKMLDDELDHVGHLRSLLNSEQPEDIVFPYINVWRVRDACNWAKKNGTAYFLLRLESSLRLECAELDFGLEGLVARRLEKRHILPGYTGDIAEHLGYLLNEAARYEQSPNIGLQIRRLTDLHETCLRETSYMVSGGTTTWLHKQI